MAIAMPPLPATIAALGLLMLLLILYEAPVDPVPSAGAVRGRCGFRRPLPCICAPWTAPNASEPYISPPPAYELHSMRDQPGFAGPFHPNPTVQRRRAEIRAGLLEGVGVVVAPDCSGRCTYRFDSTVDFALDFRAVELAKEGRLGTGSYSHPLGSQWYISLDECAESGKSESLEDPSPHVRCFIGACGWIRPALLRGYSGRLGNVLFQFSASFVGAWNLNLTLFQLPNQMYPPQGFALDWIVSSWRGELATEPIQGLDYAPDGYLVLDRPAANSTLSTEDSSKKDPFKFISTKPTWYSGDFNGQGEQTCINETSTDEIRAKLKDPKAGPLPALQYFCYCECYPWIVDFFPLLRVVSEIDPALTNMARAEKAMAELRSKHPDAQIVSFHLRSGDKSGPDYYHVDELYMRRAVDAIKERTSNATLIITGVSEDHAILKPLLEASGLPHFIFGGEPLEDMHYSRLADHFIWSIGSFSFWISVHIDGIKVSADRHFLLRPKEWTMAHYLYPGVVPIETPQSGG